VVGWVPPKKRTPRTPHLQVRGPVVGDRCPRFVCLPFLFQRRGFPLFAMCRNSCSVPLGLFPEISAAPLARGASQGGTNRSISAISALPGASRSALFSHLADEIGRAGQIFLLHSSRPSAGQASRPARPLPVILAPRFLASRGESPRARRALIDAQAKVQRPRLLTRTSSVIHFPDFRGGLLASICP